MFMINHTTVMTSIVAAIMMWISLMLLKLFNFIKWSPVGWTKRWSLFEKAHVSEKWIVLFVALLLLFFIFYAGISFLHQIPPTITSLLTATLAVLLIEWLIHFTKSPMEIFKSISVPFFVVTTMIVRFIVGTAVFMKKLSLEKSK
jgi:hypothetical protein